MLLGIMPMQFEGFCFRPPFGPWHVHQTLAVTPPKAANWPLLGKFLKMPTGKKSRFVYFCGFLRTFAGYLRTFAGFLRTVFFVFFDGLGPVSHGFQSNWDFFHGKFIHLLMKYPMSTQPMV